MNKRLFTIAIASIALIGATSCNKCVTCDSCPDDVSLLDDNDNEVESVEYCEGDFDSKEDYDLSVALIEGFGCTCK